MVEYRIVNCQGTILAVCYSPEDAGATKSQLERHLGERLFIDTARPIL